MPRPKKVTPLSFDECVKILESNAVKNEKAATLTIPFTQAEAVHKCRYTGKPKGGTPTPSEILNFLNGVVIPYTHKTKGIIPTFADTAEVVPTSSLLSYNKKTQVLMIPLSLLTECMGSEIPEGISDKHFTVNSKKSRKPLERTPTLSIGLTQEGLQLIFGGNDEDESDVEDESDEDEVVVPSVLDEEDDDDEIFGNDDEEDEDEDDDDEVEVEVEVEPTSLEEVIL